MEGLETGRSKEEGNGLSVLGMRTVSSHTYLRYSDQAGKRQALDWCYVVDFGFLRTGG